MKGGGGGGGGVWCRPSLSARGGHLGSRTGGDAHVGGAGPAGRRHMAAGCVYVGVGVRGESPNMCCHLVQVYSALRGPLLTFFFTRACV